MRANELYHWVTELEYPVLAGRRRRRSGWMGTDGCLLFCRVNNVSFLCNNYMFFEMLAQNHNLRYLNFSFTILSHIDVKLLCEVLNREECIVEKLL